MLMNGAKSRSQCQTSTCPESRYGSTSPGSIGLRTTPTLAKAIARTRAAARRFAVRGGKGGEGGTGAEEEVGRPGGEGGPAEEGTGDVPGAEEPFMPPEEGGQRFDHRPGAVGH